MLQYASECAVCGQSFLNTWLECVHFVDARKVRYKIKFVGLKYLCNPQDWPLSNNMRPCRIGIWSVKFCGGKGGGDPGEKPSEKGENQQET